MGGKIPRFMSIGEGAYANLVAWDDNEVVYEYGGYTFNDKRFRNENNLLDGVITIQRKCFAKPEIHEKLKKMPSGRKKLITKRIPVSVDYEAMIENGTITFENCSNCWQTYERIPGVDVTVLRLLFIIFNNYQKEGKIPEHVSFFK